MICHRVTNYDASVGPSCLGQLSQSVFSLSGPAMEAWQCAAGKTGLTLGLTLATRHVQTISKEGAAYDLSSREISLVLTSIVRGLPIWVYNIFQ